MNSAFGDLFLFLTNLAYKHRVVIPGMVLVTFLIMDLRLQIEVNIHSGQAAAEFEDTDDEDDVYEFQNDENDEEYTTDDSSAEEEENPQGSDVNQNINNYLMDAIL